MSVRPTLGSLPKPRSFRGQPLAIMAMVLAIWIGLRAGFWSSPIAGDDPALPFDAPGAMPREARAPEPRQVTRALPIRPVAASHAFAAHGARIEGAPSPSAGRIPPDAAASMTSGRRARVLPAVLAPGSIGRDGPAAVPGKQASPAGTFFSLPVRPIAAGRPARFSIDGWLFLRRAGGGTGRGKSGAPFAPTYGRSQFGAVLRYDLGPDTAILPQAYLRAAGAADSREADFAVGVGVRPVAALPLRAHGEVRLSRIGERTEVRPSAFVTAGLDEPLPFGTRVRGYAQAGYVGGEFATGFADGSLVVERDAKRFESAGRLRWEWAPGAGRRRARRGSMPDPPPAWICASVGAACDWRRITASASPDARNPLRDRR